MNFWRNLHLFEYHERTKKSLKVARWSIIFVQIFFQIIFSFPQWHIKLGTGLATPKKVFVPPLLKANAIKMFVNDGEMLFNDGDMSVGS